MGFAPLLLFLRLLVDHPLINLLDLSLVIVWLDGRNVSVGGLPPD